MNLEQKAPSTEPGGTWTPRIRPVVEPNGWREEGWFCWGASPHVGPGEEGPRTVHLFGARWPEWSGFLGWLLRSEVCRLTAPGPQGPFTYRETVLGPRPGTRPGKRPYWDQHNAHNPTLIRVGDTHCLFYTGTFHDPARPIGEREVPRFVSYEEGPYGWPRMHQRVGLATAPALTGPWTRMDRPLLEPDEAWAPFFTNCPSACVGPDGRIYLYYKSIDPVKKRMKIGVATAERPEGPYTKHPGNPVADPGPHHHIEDHFVWYAPDGFHMICKDMTGGVVGVPNATFEMTSPDGFHWDLGAARLAYHPGWPTPAGWHPAHRMEQPNLLLEDGRPSALYCAVLNLPEEYDRYHYDHPTLSEAERSAVAEGRLRIAARNVALLLEPEG